MCLNKLKKTFLLLSTSLLFNYSLHAQQSTVSPYSRYGIGELQPSATVAQSGMGSIGTAFYGQDRLNFLNPASYSFDTITTFEPGVRGEYSNLATSSAESQNASGVYLANISIGFPVIKNKLGASIGVLPYSNMGYNVSNKETDPQIGTINSKFKGDGGISRFYFGMGYAPFATLQSKFIVSEKYKKLVADKKFDQIVRKGKFNTFLSGFSIGFNASWLFGPLNTTRSVEFTVAPYSYNTRIINIVSLGDLYLNFGALYTLKLKKEKFFNVGIAGATSTDIRSSYSSLWYNYTSTGGIFETVIDTVQIITDQIGYTTIPLYYSGGISMGRTGKWLVEVDYTTQKWSKFNSFDDPNTLKDGYKISFGGEWIPNKKSFDYVKKIQYRLGGHYTKSYVNINNTDIKDYGLSFGCGLPIINKDRIQKAVVQLGFEVGRNGTIENDLLRQQYIRFHVGITLNESWFFKRKYE